MSSFEPFLVTSISFETEPRNPQCQVASAVTCRERAWTAPIMILTDALALQAALYLGFHLRLALTPLWPVGLSPNQYLTLALGVLFGPLAYVIARLYPGYGLGIVERLRARTLATITVFAALTAWDYLVHKGMWSRGVFLATSVFALVLPPLLESILITVLIRFRLWGTPVIILGAGPAGRRVVSNLRQRPDYGLIPAGFLDDRAAYRDTEVDGVHVIGGFKEAHRLSPAIRIAILAMPHIRPARLTAILEKLPFPRVIVIPNLKGMQSLWLTARNLGGTVGLELQRNLLLRRNYYTKRCIDYLIAVPALILSAPVIAFFAAWIKLVSRGPAFYSQEREGSAGNPIRVWKLRTMHQNAGELLEGHLAADPDARREWQKYFKLKNDPRILPGVGKILRRTSLDELPQLWNVVRGDMSVVGPRPFPAYHMAEFKNDFRELRGRVIPGITGLWQVSARSDGDLQVQQSLDTYYIRNWSIWLDVYVLISTFRAVLLSKGAY